MMKKLLIGAGTAAILSLAATSIHAEATAEQVASLGGDTYTPYGADRAGNADGSIPEWTGGITSSADAGFPGFTTGGHHPDPYATDDVLYTINAQNMGQYAEQMTEG